MIRVRQTDDGEETENDGDEYDGYSLIDENGDEIGEKKPTKKKTKENYDDGETVDASPIPLNEQLVILDNPDVSGLTPGAPLTLRLLDGTGAVYNGDNKIGGLKPAFTEKLLLTRAGFYCSCLLYSVSAPVMVKLLFYETPKDGTILI